MSKKQDKNLNFHFDHPQKSDLKLFFGWRCSSFICLCLDMSQQQQYPLHIKWMSYAGLLFFWFLVQWQLKDPATQLSAEQKQFVLGYVKLGHRLLGVVVGIAMWRWLSVRWGRYFLDGRIGVLVGSLIWMVGIAMIMIAQWRSLITPSSEIKKEERNQILSFFIPGIATKRWFDGLASGKIVRWMKEAEIWRFVLMLVGILDFGWYLRGGGVLLMLMRCGMILLGKDLIPPEWKVSINTWMIKRGEELFLLPWVLLSRWGSEESTLALEYQLKQKALFEKGKLSLWIWFLFLLIGMWALMRGILGWAPWKLIVMVYRLSRGMILMSKNQL